MRSAAATPLMQQYLDIKSQHSDSILFFRMGDFYEMFYEDAELAARELGLTLTTRNNGGAARVPLAGVPVKAASEYLRKLVDKGHRVAVCEQIEDPKQAKGVVKRAVVETLSPGSILESEWLETKQNNFMVSVLPGPTECGIAALDVSTGEFIMDTARPGDLTDSVKRFDPRELVVPEGTDWVPGTLVVTRDSWEFDPKLAAEDLRSRFRLATLDGLGIADSDMAALGAAGALLRYASELRPAGLPQIAHPDVRRMGGTVLLDEMTRRNLELVENLRADTGALTLYDVLDRTRTSMGARLLRRRLLSPLNVSADINRRLDAVAELVDARSIRVEVRESLDPVRDIERLSGRAASGRATPRDLGALRDSLSAIPAVAGALAGCSSAELERGLGELDPLDDLLELLRRFLSDEPPAAFGHGDSIRRGADKELDDARDLRDGGKEFIAGIQARERARTGIGSLKVGYNKVFGYYIEVTKANKNLVPTDYDRRQTLTNAERYITPELKEYEARVLGAEDRVDERERELIEMLRKETAERLARLQATARVIAEIDVAAALAEVATRENYVRPVVDDGFDLELRGSRHPVVEQMLPGGRFIPNDVTLGESGRVMLLTGPNMAGKSTILRQVGVIAAMAQMGSFVPAKSARIGVVDRIFTRVGASDKLVSGQSTFMVEMAETSAILHGATNRSLILLDEIGRGTSTYDGVAIAWSVTEYIHDRIGCKTVFATHYHELTQLTDELQHAINCNVAVRETGDRIIFLHRLEPGGTDRSYGIHVGKLAGLPEGVVERSWEILRRLEAQHHVVDQPTPKTPDRSQLVLFEREDKLREGLRSLDPNTMTPIEALSRLAELKRISEEE